MSERRRKLPHLPITVFKQVYSFSCVAAIIEIVNEYIGGGELSHAEAIRLSESNPDGAELKMVSRVLRRLCKAKSRTLPSLASAKRELRNGNLVVSHDETSYVDSHAVLFCGATERGIYVCDPNTAKINLRSDGWLKESGATEFIAIFPAADLSARRKPAGKRKKAARIGK